MERGAGRAWRRRRRRRRTKENHETKKRHLTNYFCCVWTLLPLFCFFLGGGGSPFVVASWFFPSFGVFGSFCSSCCLSQDMEFIRFSPLKKDHLETSSCVCLLWLLLLFSHFLFSVVFVWLFPHLHLLFLLSSLGLWFLVFVVLLFFVGSLFYVWSSSWSLFLCCLLFFLLFLFCLSFTCHFCVPFVFLCVPFVFLVAVLSLVLLLVFFLLFTHFLVICCFGIISVLFFVLVLILLLRFGVHIFWKHDVVGLLPSPYISYKSCFAFLGAVSCWPVMSLMRPFWAIKTMRIGVSRVFDAWQGNMEENSWVKRRPRTS